SVVSHIHAVPERRYGAAKLGPGGALKGVPRRARFSSQLPLAPRTHAHGRELAADRHNLNRYWHFRNHAGRRNQRRWKKTRLQCAV
ncbi:MAG: hypothetical protein L0099_08460, partial [Acidobacteria bacterium]|nr:hypothetical protein [Acidobacteriota bacterium]